MKKTRPNKSKLIFSTKSNESLIDRLVAEEVYADRVSRFEEVTVTKRKNKAGVIIVLSFVALVLIVVLGYLLFFFNERGAYIVYADGMEDIEEVISSDLEMPEYSDYVYAVRPPLGADKLTGIRARSIYSFSPELSRVFAAKNEDQEVAIASITKVMTALASEDIFGSGDQVCVLEETRLYGSLDLVKNDCFVRDDLLVHMLVSSSNDAAEQLRLNAAEREIDLVAYMNTKAKTLSLGNTSFSNTLGLDAENNYSTAKESAVLFSQLVSNTDLLKRLSVKEARLKAVNTGNTYKYETTNELLKERSDVLAGKTGFTSDAGGTLVVLTKKPSWNFTLITVVLGTGGNSERFEEMSKLLDLIYKEFDL